MKNAPEPELDPEECVDAQGTVRPEHDIPSDVTECRRCGAEVMPEETEE
jgi:hypothetical protein